MIEKIFRERKYIVCEKESSERKKRKKNWLRKERER